MSSGPFDYVNAINNGHDIVIGKDYNQFLINKAFSYHMDCIPYIDYINQYTIPNEAHFRFLRSVISPRKRHSRWPKPQVSAAVKVVMQYYQISQREAEQYITVLSEQDISQITSAISMGK